VPQPFSLQGQFAFDTALARECAASERPGHAIRGKLVCDARAGYNDCVKDKGGQRQPPRLGGMPMLGLGIGGRSSTTMLPEPPMHSQVVAIHTDHLDAVMSDMSLPTSY
jgi:hypothetical protein